MFIATNIVVCIVCIYRLWTVFIDCIYRRGWHAKRAGVSPSKHYLGRADAKSVRLRSALRIYAIPVSNIQVVTRCPHMQRKPYLLIAAPIEWRTKRRKEEENTTMAKSPASLDPRRWRRCREERHGFEPRPPTTVFIETVYNTVSVHSLGTV